MRAALTDLSVRSLKASTAQYKVWDTKTPGFGIRVNGVSKSWIVMFGKTRTQKVLGRYPDLPLAEARRKALIELGTQSTPSRLPTYPEARDLFLSQNRWKASSKYAISRTLRKHFTWQKSIDKITHNEIARAIEAIEKKSEACHALKDIKTFFNWCVPRFLPHSPCDGIKMPFKMRPRDRVLTEEELVAVWRTAEAYGYPFGTIVRCLILTGQRRGEIGGLKAEYLDCARRTISLPPEQTKNGRRHIFPVSNHAVALLQETGIDEGFFFPARGSDEAFSGYSTSKICFDKLCPIEPWTLHDLRRTFASTMAMLGVRIEVTERLLNHVSGTFGGIVGIYQRYDFMAEMRAAIDKYDAYLQELVGGKHGREFHSNHAAVVDLSVQPDVQDVQTST